MNQSFPSDRSDGSRNALAMVRNRYISTIPNTTWCEREVDDLRSSQSSRPMNPYECEVWTEYDTGDDNPVWEHFLSIGDNKVQSKVREQKRKQKERQDKMTLNENSNRCQNGRHNSKTIADNTVDDFGLDDSIPLPPTSKSSRYHNDRNQFNEHSSDVGCEQDCKFNEESIRENRRTMGPLQGNDVAVGIAEACLIELSTIFGALNECNFINRNMHSQSSRDTAVAVVKDVSVPMRPKLVPSTFVMADDQSSPRSVMCKSLSEQIFISSSASPKSAMKRCVSVDSNSAFSNYDYGRTSSIKRSVSFSKLQIREYTSIEISDNPSCSSGTPIQLGWEYNDNTISVDVDQYEEQRSPRRKLNQMMLSYHVRRFLLLYEGGFSNAEITRAARDVEKVKEQRRSTKYDTAASISKKDVMYKGFEHMDNDENHTVDNVCRFFKNVFHLGN